MPSFKTWNDSYHADGLLFIFDNDADSMADAENYLIDVVGFTSTDHVQYIGETNPDVWAQYGYGGYPTMVLIDRDGNIRKQSLGAIDGEPFHSQWQTVIEQLVGP